MELLERLGYQYIYAHDIAHDGERHERNSYEDVLLSERLQNAICRINPKGNMGCGFPALDCHLFKQVKLESSLETLIREV